MTDPNVAGPRQLISRETYTGAELAVRSSRPGAYDAMKIPSLFNGKAVAPGAELDWPAAPAMPATTMRARSVVCEQPSTPPAPPAPPATAAPRPKVTTYGRPRSAAYQPREGSVPWRVLAALNEGGPGACFTNAQIEEQFGLPQKQIPGSLCIGIEKGALIRTLVAGRMVVALPGFVPPIAAAPAPVPVPASKPVSRAKRSVPDAIPQPDAAAAIAQFESLSLALSRAFDQLAQQAQKASAEILATAKDLQLTLSQAARRPPPRSPLF